MLIQCEKCSTRYNLDEAKIPGKGAKVTCPSCKHVFIVMKGATPGAPATIAPSGAPPGPPPMQAPPSAAGKSLLDNFFDDSKTTPGQTPFGEPTAAPATPLAGNRGSGIRSWKVRVASGLVYDFTDVATLKAWIAERKVTTADQISADGASWTVIGTIANLDGFFGNPAAPPMGAPGPAPLTGFGPPPSAGPAAPAFSAPAATSGSLADLFNAPPPGSGGASADPFGGNSSPAPGNPFGPAPAPLPPAAPRPGGNPFGPGPSANPFGPGAADPFASAPPEPPPSAAPAFGADPFGSAPPPSNGSPSPFSADPFGAAPGAEGASAPFGAPPPPSFGPKPAPPPWLSGPAPVSTPAAPAPPAALGGPPPPFAPSPTVSATAKPTSWSAAGEGLQQPLALPTTKPRGKIGKTLGMVAAGMVVLALGGGLVMNFDRVQAMLRPVPTPIETPTPPPIVRTLEGEARDHYLRGRRLLRLDTPEAYKQAETEFRAALSAANANPRAAAGVLESLALQKQAGATIGDDVLQLAQATAGAALKEDAQGLETNRALAQLDAVSGRPADALGRLETALAAHPGDPESLFLRSKLRAADPAQATAAAEDLTLAAADPTLTRAVVAKAEGAKPKSPELQAAEQLAAANAATVAAITAGTWTWTPEEFPRLLPGVPVPTATPAATATPVESAVAVVSATPAPAASVAAPTPTPGKTPLAAVSATPAKTPLASASPAPTKTPLASASPLKTKAPSPTRTPLAAKTADPNGDTTPEPGSTPEGTQVATASASDHFMAGQAYEQAASWDDAIAEYAQAVKLSSKTSSYRLALGTAQFRGGKLQDAATTLSELLEREPSNASAHRMLGLLFDATGQSANACGEFQEYLRIKPQAPDAGDIRARMVRNGC